jgi:hypothetical protein
MAAPKKAQGNTTLTYNANALQNWTKSVKVSADGKSIDVTALGDTAKATIADTVEWSVTADFNWDSVIDGYLTPDAITPGTSRTLVLSHDDDTNYVSLTWTSLAQVQSISFDDSVGDVHKGTVTFALSGAPVRATGAV